MKAATTRAGALGRRRVINGPLADRRQDACRAVIIIAWLAPLGFDVSVDVVGVDLVSAARLVLVY
jgi:hypothetical protein